MKSPQLKSPPLNNSFYILSLEENINKLEYRVVLLTLFDHLIFQHSLLIILINQHRISIELLRREI